MASNHDDIEAIKTVVDALSPFDPVDQERIVRWACEKLGLVGPSSHQVGPSLSNPGAASHLQIQPAVVQTVAAPGTQRDIKSFVSSKNPTNDMQFAATVAYFFAFESPEAQRKESIGPGDLQDACRQLGRERLQNPGQTLRNACYHGLLDKAGDRGNYTINTVGENLIAVTLPNDSGDAAKRKRRTPPAKRTKRKKNTGRRPAAKR